MHDAIDPFPHTVIRADPPYDWPFAEAERSFDLIDWRKPLSRPGSVMQKFVCNNPRRFPEPVNRIIANLNSEEMLSWLRECTGVEELIADPTIAGGGMHMTRRGGYLKVHADFNWNPDIAAHRRVNLLLYLNSDWKEEWGGELELWTQDMKRCVRKIAPTIGTIVIFNTTDTSYHGHPNPLMCPEDRARKSIALYYYTVEAPAEVSAPHSTVYRDEKAAFA